MISADEDIFEAPDAYQKRMPKKLKDAAPRVETSADDIDTWVCDGEASLVVGGLATMAGTRPQDYGNAPLQGGRQAMPRGFSDAGERTWGGAVTVRPWRASSRQART